MIIPVPGAAWQKIKKYIKNGNGVCEYCRSPGRVCAPHIKAESGLRQPGFQSRPRSFVWLLHSKNKRKESRILSSDAAVHALTTIIYILNEMHHHVLLSVSNSAADRQTAEERSVNLRKRDTDAEHSFFLLTDFRYNLSAWRRAVRDLLGKHKSRPRLALGGLCF